VYDPIDVLGLHREVTNRAHEAHRAAADRSLLRAAGRQGTRHRLAAALRRTATAVEGHRRAI
jgi:hypothetical protein